jgi:hypothetical protein
MGDIEEEFKAKNLGGVDWLKLKPPEINNAIDACSDVATLRAMLKKMATTIWFLVQTEIVNR